MAAEAHVRADPVTATARGYDVIVRAGVLRDAASLIAAAAPAAAYAVITPDALVSNHGTRILEHLRAAGLSATLFPCPDGEAHKTRETWAALTDRMLEAKLGRDCCVVALGGGVTGDMAGFVAATYMRGVPLIQIPTTLLAMIDASVGGKTGVDTAAGKNLVGAFHPPHLVIVDPAELRTLPAVQLRSGLAEAVKHGAILDAAYFTWIGEHTDELLAFDAGALEHLITRSIELKAQVVSEDPLEGGRRAILNFGHTLGHALESSSGYAMPHGFAVSAGLCLEAALGEAVGVTTAGASRELAHLLARLGLPTHASASTDALLEAMRVDKKARGARPRFVLLRTIGECARAESGGWTHALAEDVIKRILESGTAESGRV